MAKAKIKADLVALARGFLASDDFKPEVVKMIPAEVVYSFEAAMETVLTSTEGLSTFKSQWTSAYRKFAKAWAKDELEWSWTLAKMAAHDYVERESLAGNDGQSLFDQRYSATYLTHFDEVQKIRRLGWDFEEAASKERIKLLDLTNQMNALVAVTLVKKIKVAKPGSASKRNLRKGVTEKGGGKKRGVKGSRHNKKR